MRFNGAFAERGFADGFLPGVAGDRGWVLTSFHIGIFCVSIVSYIPAPPAFYNQIIRKPPISGAGDWRVVVGGRAGDGGWCMDGRFVADSMPKQYPQHPQDL